MTVMAIAGFIFINANVVVRKNYFKYMKKLLTMFLIIGVCAVLSFWVSFVWWLSGKILNAEAATITASVPENACNQCAKICGQ